jgi:hypothetical protein
MDDLNSAQKIGLIFTLIIGLIIVIFSLITAVAVSKNPLPKPDLKLGQNETQDSKAKEISNYSELSTAMHSRATATFDLVVAKTLLPIFNTLLATILGFVFIRKTAEVVNNYLNLRRDNLRGRQERIDTI